MSDPAHTPARVRPVLHALALALALLPAVACRGAPSAASDAPAASEVPAGPYVLVLGTAQDGGLPHMGCARDCCEEARADPARRRLVTSLLLVDPRTGRRWLLDASPDLVEQEFLAREHPAGWSAPAGRGALFDGIFLTHAHVGHYAGLAQLGREAYGVSGQAVFASPAMAAFLRTSGPWSLSVETGGLVLHELEAGRAVELGVGLSITPLPVPHRDEFSDTLAFLVCGPERALLYLPDVDAWDALEPAIESLLGDVDVALVDGTFFSGGELPGRDLAQIRHPLIVDSLGRFGSLPARERAKVVFTHLNHTNPAADPASAAAAAVRAAGMSVARLGDAHRL